MSDLFVDDVLKAINDAKKIESIKTDDEIIYCNINRKTREIEVPDGFEIFGVESDQDSTRVYFRCPRYVGTNLDIDLTECVIYVAFINAAGEKDQYIVDDISTFSDTVEFSWLVSRKASAYLGTTEFGVKAVITDDDGNIKIEWNTAITNANILDGIETDNYEPSDDQKDVIAQLVQLINTTAENSIENINESEENAINAIETQQQQSIIEVNNAKNQAINTIEQTGEEVKDSLPDDYTEMSVNVDELLKRISVIEILLDNFEFGRELGNYSDLDDCVKSGIYYWNNGVKPINGVANVTPAGLFVLPISDTDVSQIIVSKDKRIYKRYSSDGIWSDFVSIKMSDIFENYYLLLADGNNITDRNNNKLVARAFMKGE